MKSKTIAQLDLERDEALKELKKAPKRSIVIWFVLTVLIMVAEALQVNQNWLYQSYFAASFIGFVAGYLMMRVDLNGSIKLFKDLCDQLEDQVSELTNVKATLDEADEKNELRIYHVYQENDDTYALKVDIMRGEGKSERGVLVMYAKNYQDIEEDMIRRGLTRMAVDPADDPRLKESWL